jgi:hypothetical protein
MYESLKLGKCTVPKICSEDICRAYLAETAEIAYNGRNDKVKSELALGTQAQVSMINIIVMSFILLYKVVGPAILFVSILLMVWGGQKSRHHGVPTGGHHHEVVWV